ncbi:MAG: hypothetical protein ABI304_06405 [Rudaea sp.]
MASIKHHRDGNVVQFRGRGVRAQLREAMDERVPLQIARERTAPGWVHGYAIAMSSEFCLIAEVSDTMCFDGFLVVAVGDVTSVEQDPGREFVERALQMNEQKFPELPDFNLDDWQRVAESAALVEPLIALNMLDEDNGEVSYIGRLVGAQSDGLIMQEIDPNAVWYPDTGGYEFPSIGSIGFGTAYMNLLARVAGTPPVPQPDGEFLA